MKYAYFVGINICFYCIMQRRQCLALVATTFSQMLAWLPCLPIGSKHLQGNKSWAMCYPFMPTQP